MPARLARHGTENTVTNVGSFKGRYVTAGTARQALQGWHGTTHLLVHGWPDNLGTNLRFGPAWHGLARGQPVIWTSILEAGLAAGHISVSQPQFQNSNLPSR